MASAMYSVSPYMGIREQSYIFPWIRIQWYYKEYAKSIIGITAITARVDETTAIMENLLVSVSISGGLVVVAWVYFIWTRWARNITERATTSKMPIKPHKTAHRAIIAMYAEG